MLAPLETASKLHDVTIVTRKTYKCARVEGVPPEEFGVERDAKLEVQKWGYCFHEVVRRQSDLITDGYDPDQIKNLPGHTSQETSETLARDTVDESRSLGGDDALNEANRLIRITEHYIRMDYEDNGKAALYRVTTGGDEGDILRRDMSEDDEKTSYEDEIVKVDLIPFACITPVIVTHRFFGRSVADLVMDIQRIKTSLLRGMLNNLYLHNNPRVEVAESHASDNTLDDLLVSRPGGIVRSKQPGGINWQEVPDITNSIYPALQYFDATREWRTGVTRQGQGVDPNALQNQVATIANQMLNASQAKIKLIARIFAETGIRDLFWLLHATIRKNGDQAETVRLRNNWVDVDPREWRERNDMTINVGLGTGSKTEQLAGTQLLIGAQEKGIAAGLVSKKNLYNSARELTKLLGHKNVDEFFVAPGKPPAMGANGQPDQDSAPIPPPVDPKKAIEELKLQHSREVEQLKQAGNVNEAQLRAQLDREKAQADTMREFSKAQADASLAAAKADFDARLAVLNHQIETRELAMKAEFEAQKHAMEMRHAEQKHTKDMELAEHKAKSKGNKNAD